MIPILYAENEYEFLTYGIGGLSEASRCLVTEERNGQYELVMDYPASGALFSEIQHSRKILATPSDGVRPQPFEIYKISKPINGMTTINAQHVSYQLTLIPVAPFTATTCPAALAGIKSNSLESNPFEFWTDKTLMANYSQTVPQSARERLGGVRGSILDVYGGEYEWDRYTVKLHASRGQDNGASLRYGKNITDIKQEENIASTYTGAVGVWTGKDENNQDVCVYTDAVQTDSADAYPYHRTTVLDFTAEYQNQPTKEQLTARTRSYLRDNDYGVPKVNLKVSFIPLWETEEYKELAVLEHINLCDVVTVYFEKLDIHAKAKVVKTVYDVLLDRYKSIEIGDAKTY